MYACPDFFQGSWLKDPIQTADQQIYFFPLTPSQLITIRKTGLRSEMLRSEPGWGQLFCYRG